MRAALLLATGLAAVAPSAGAMRFHADPPFLHLQGRVVDDDFRIFQDAFRTFGDKLQVVVLQDSPGGHALTGRRIGEWIRSRGLRTVVAGRCASACANMFLGGRHRHFAATLRERPATLGFHGSYNAQSGAVKWDADTDYYVAMTDGKLGEDFAQVFLKLENQRGLLYFIHPAQRESDDKALAYLCQGTEQHDRRDKECRSLADVDALGKGVVTTWDAVRVPRMPSAEETQSRRNW